MAEKDPKDGEGRELEQKAREAETLIGRARQAFRLRPEEVMAASVKDGLVTLVTIGAHKARWREGDQVKPLHPLHAGRSVKPVPPPTEA
jgi:hypothetical protein